MLCLDSSKIDILFVMTDIDKDILTDIRAALLAIREQIDVIDRRLERMTEICSGDADTVAEEPAAVLPVEDAEAAAEVAVEAFEDAVGEEIQLEADDVAEVESGEEAVPAVSATEGHHGEESDTEECVADAEEALSGERENFFVGEEISLGGDPEMAFADSASLENAGAEENANTIDVTEALAEAEEFAKRVTEVEEVAPTLSGIVENDEETEVFAEVAAAADAVAEEVMDAAGEINTVADVAEKPKEPVRFAWRTDRPGSPVRNILSAISLNDRMLFIRTLFNDDPALFQKTISVFNSLSSLAEAEAYIRSHFPKWDMSSDTVYRFMMAARRRFS